MAKKNYKVTRGICHLDNQLINEVLYEKKTLNIPSIYPNIGNTSEITNKKIKTNSQSQKESMKMNFKITN